MLSHKTLLDKRQRKGGFFTHKGFSQERIEGSPGPDPPIDYLAVGESTAGSGRCVCRARGVARGAEWPGDHTEGGELRRMPRSCWQECLQIVTSI